MKVAPSSVKAVPIFPILLGGLLLVYSYLSLEFLVRRREARSTSSDGPVRQIGRWKRFCGHLCAVLLVGAIPWISAIPVIFASLGSSLNKFCPSLISQAECDRATLLWQQICSGLIGCACVAVVIIIWITQGAVNWTVSNSDHLYPIFLLASSHGLLVISFISCEPLKYPLEAFSIIGKRHWSGVITTIAFFAILAYIIGGALWILASIKVLYVWLSGRRDNTITREQWPGEFERELIRLDMYP